MSGRRPGRAWIELDLGALERNVAALRRWLPEGCRLMPALKANAYGHGALPIAAALNRMGVDAKDRESLAKLYSLPGLKITGVFSHLCVSDDLSASCTAFTLQQAEAFQQALSWLKEQGFPVLQAHLLASYGIFNIPEKHFDLVRAGIALYGVYSDDTPTRRTLPLQPVLSLKARVALVRSIAPGETA